MQLAILDSGELLAGTTHGLYMSINGGQNWQIMTGGIAEDLFVWDLDASSDGQILLAAIEQGVYISSSISSDFTQEISGLQHENIYAITAGDAGLHLAGSENGHVFRFSSLTNSWEPIFQSPNPARNFVWSMINPAKSEFVFSQDRDGLYRSSDSGASWVTDNNGLIASEILSMIASAHGLLISSRKSLFTFRSGVWTEVTFNDMSWSSRCLHQTRSGNILACSNSGLVQISLSNNQGRFTHQVLGSLNIVDIAEDDQGNIYVADWEKGVFRGRVDEDWLEISNEEMRASIVTTLEITVDQDLFVGTHQALWRLGRESDAWEEVIAESPSIQGLESDAQGNIYAITFPGIRRSLDRGQSWTSHAVSEVRPVRDLIALDDQTLLAATERDGIYLSSDHGDSWRPFAAGLRTSTVNTLLKMDDQVFAGTSGGGVYHLDLPTNYQQVQARETITIFPNPATNSLYLKWTEAIRKEINICVYDAVGRKLSSHQLDLSPSGLSVLDISEMPNGIYYMTIPTAEHATSQKFIKMN